jgi:hypothetical protein
MPLSRAGRMLLRTRAPRAQAHVAKDALRERISAHWRLSVSTC